jgi:hypothetical protein
MMAVRKHQNIVQWSYPQLPLNVVPRIPLLGYLDLDQGHTCQMKEREYPTDPNVSREKGDYTAPETRASANGCPAQHSDRKANPGTGQQ